MSGEIKKAKLIIYTDGGARPNPGFSGFGVHMYVGYYNGKSVAVEGKYAVTSLGYNLKSEMVTPRHIQQIIKDNRLVPDIEENKTMELLQLGEVFDYYGYYVNSDTNNTAELNAATLALNKISVVLESLKDTEVTDTLLLLDSTYVLIFLKNMIVNKFNLKDVSKNYKEVKELYDAYISIKDRVRISVGKVPAHAEPGNLGNDRADLLATMGIFMQQGKVQLTDRIESLRSDKTYWRDSSFNTDLFYCKQLFSYAPDAGENSKVYYGINYKDLTDMGKKISNITYTIISLPKPDEIISEIVKIIRDVLGKDYYPYVINLDVLTNRKLLRDYLRYGKDFLSVSKKRSYSIVTPTGLVVAEVLEHPALSHMVMDRFIQLRNHMADIVNGKPLMNLNTIDITNFIYTKSKKDTTMLLPDIKTDKYIIKVPYKHNDDYRAITIRTRLKLDMPGRNTIKRFERLEPKVMLLLEYNKNIIEYSTLTQLDNDINIFSSNVYANRLILKQTKRK